MRMGWKSVDKVQPGGSSSLDLFARSRRFRLTATLLNNTLWVALARVCVFQICSRMCKSFRLSGNSWFLHSHRIPWTEGSAVRWAEAELREFSGVTSRRSCIRAREHLRKRDTEGRGRGTQGTWGTPKDTKVKISAQALICLLLTGCRLWIYTHFYKQLACCFKMSTVFFSSNLDTRANCSEVSWLIRRRQVEYFTAEWSLQIFLRCSFSSNSIPRREHFWPQSVVVHFSASQNQCLPGKVFFNIGLDWDSYWKKVG